MRCPTCGKEISSVVVQRMPALSENFGGTIKCVAYCCELCQSIISVESDPLERDAQMTNLQDELLSHVKQADVLMRKYVGLKETLKAAPPNPPATDGGDSST